MIETLEVSVPLRGKKEARRAYVYLPEKEGNFPVLYMFDGQTAFFDERAPYGESWRMGEILSSRKTPMIVAAVECGEERLTEYSPFPFTSEYGSSEGRGEEYMTWLTEEFKPLIDRSFPTKPAREHTFLCGSSMGGLMTLYGVSAFPAVFGGGAALSPSVWIDPEKCAEMIEKAAWKTPPLLYLDYGEKELKTHGARQIEGLTSCVSALVKRGVPFTFRLIEGGTHSERSWRASVPEFLRIFLPSLGHGTPE